MFYVNRRDEREKEGIWIKVRTKSQLSALFGESIKGRVETGVELEFSEWADRLHSAGIVFAIESFKVLKYSRLTFKNLKLQPNTLKHFVLLLWRHAFTEKGLSAK